MKEITHIITMQATLITKHETDEELNNFLKDATREEMERIIKNAPNATWDDVNVLEYKVFPNDEVTIDAT